MKIMTRQETADYLRISLRTLARLEARGKLPSRIQVSDRIFCYRESDIIAYFSGTTPGRSEPAPSVTKWRVLSSNADID